MSAMQFPFDRSQYMKSPPLRMIAYAVIAMLLSVVHIVFLRFISVSSVTPDLLLILTVWIAIVEGQFTGMVAGFLCGLLFDVVSAQVPGTNALVKTLAGFIAGYFYRESDAMALIGSVRFLLITALAATVDSFTYNFFYVKPMQTSFWMFFVKYGVATTLYTTVAAVFPMLVVNRRKDP